MDDTVKYACIINISELNVVHEFSHGFGNQLANEWYETNSVFRDLCDDAVDLDSMPQYNHELAIAFEYIDKTYIIFYQYDQDQRMTDRYTMLSRFHLERRQGFGNMEEVFNMLLAYEDSR